MKTNKWAMTLALGLCAFAAAMPASAARQVSGIVNDNSGAPVAGVKVRVWDVNPGMDDNVLLGETETGSDGRFSVRYKTYRDPGPFNNLPDIRVTIETPAMYASGNWFDRAGSSTFGTESTHVASGRTTILAWWPGFNQQHNDWDDSRDISTGTLSVERNQWESVRTKFDPLVHGFNFTNPKRNICWGPTCQPPWNNTFVTKQSLCGGMSLAALKKFAGGRCDTYTQYQEIPKANADGNRLPPGLKEELVTRQMETFVFDPYVNASNLDDMLRNLSSQPLPNFPGFRFLDWQQKQEVPGSTPGPSIGDATKDQWPLIRAHLRDRKLPAVLGLVHARAQALNYLDVDLVSNNHQVLAIGYDYSPYYRTATLYIYDPNYPGEIRELQFKEQLKHSRMFIDYDARATRGFFLNVAANSAARAPQVDCPAAPRQWNLGVSKIEVRDASALDLAAPVAGKPLGVYVSVKNTGDQPVSGRALVKCGVAKVGTPLDALPYETSEAVQLKPGKAERVRLALPALSADDEHHVKCNVQLAGTQPDVVLGDNTRSQVFDVAPADTPLGTLEVAIESANWQRYPLLPFDRGLRVSVTNAGRFLAKPGASIPNVALRCTSPATAWTGIVAMPAPSSAPRVKLPSLSTPYPERTSSLDLLLRPVIKPPFPGTKQLPENMLLLCTTYVGDYVESPELPGQVQPPPPLGATIWKGSSNMTFVNDESEQ